MDGGVPVTVKDDRRYGAGALAADRRALAHGGEGGGKVAGGPGGQAGMHADSGIEIGVGSSHDGRRRPAGREPGDVDAARADRVSTHDLLGDSRDQQGLGLTTTIDTG